MATITTGIAVIFSQYAGAATVLRSVTEPALRAHAERFGHDVWLLDDALVGNRAKLAGFSGALAERDVAVWVDADALVTAGASDLAGLVDDRHWCALVVDDREFGWRSHLWVLRRGDEATRLLAMLESALAELVRLDGVDGALRKVLGDPSVPGVREVAFDTSTLSGAGVIHAGSECGSYAARVAVLRQAAA